MPTSCSHRASTPSAPTWWTDSCWLRRGELEQARRLFERAEAAGTRIIDPHLLGPLYAAWWRSRRRAGRRRGRDARWSKDGPDADWTAVRHPTHRRAAAGRGGASGHVRAVPAAARGCPALLDARAGASLRPLPAPGTPWRTSTCAPPRRSCPADLGLGRTGAGWDATRRSLPRGVRAPAARGGAAGAAGRPRRGRGAPARRARHGAPDRRRRTARARRGPRTALPA